MQAPLMNARPRQAAGKQDVDFAITERRTVAGDVLDGVPEGVAQVEGGAHAALPLVRRHHLRLVYARPLDRVRERLHMRCS